MTTPTEVIPGKHAENLSWLLEQFADRVDGVRSAVLISRDGIAVAYVGLDRDAAERTGAAISGFYAVAVGLDAIEDPQDVKQLAIEAASVTVLVMSARPEHEDDLQSRRAADRAACILAVQADPDADPGPIAYEMSSLVTGVADHLTLAVRSENTAGSGERPSADRDGV